MNLVKIKQKLVDIGILADLEDDSILFVKASINYVEQANDERSLNKRAWTIVRLVGEIADHLMIFTEYSSRDVENLGASCFSDAQIESWVADAAAKIHLEDRDLILAAQSCLCYWTRSEAVKSIGYRLGNLTLIAGAIAEAINE